VPSWESAPARPLSVEPLGSRQLAVLPLANISPDPSDAYFADGLTEELISVLSQVRGLNVIARTSVMPYKSAPKSVAQVGSELGVDTVLEGSVRKSGNRLRITLQLIDVATQHHIWASSYNREIDDVFAVQSDIAERTAEALRLELGPDRSSGGKRRPTSSLAAYELYLRGLASLSRAASQSADLDITESIQYFEQATRIDPSFAEAFAAWGNTYVMAAGDTIAMPEAIAKARELVARALQIDPESSGAHAALANIAFQYDNDWAFAEAEFRQAIALNPSNVPAHRFYGLMVFALGRFDDAKALIRRAIQLDPAGHLEGFLAWVEFESGNVEAGLRSMEELRDKHPSDIDSHIYLGIYYAAVGRRAAAIREASFPLDGATDSQRFDHAILEALLGRPSEARRTLAQVAKHQSGTYVSATHRAMIHAALGETAAALDLLERDYRDGDRVLWLWSRGAFFDSLRNEPRFLALLEKYGLPVDSIQHPPRLSAARGTPGHVRGRTHARGR
jgi:TolB-like protein/Flp pilus assembly protein TadD